MRSGHALGLVTLASFGACAKLDLPPEEHQGMCGSSVVLDGAQGSTATFDLDLGATAICMQLDASKAIDRAHFDLSVDGVGLHSRLVDLDDVLLREGWDLSLAADRTLHKLELTLDAGDVKDVVLHVSRTGAHAPGRVTVSLFEPLE